MPVNSEQFEPRGPLSPDQASTLWQRLLGGHREEIKPENNLWAHFLPEGCRRCLLGGRLCLTLGERCPKDCFYCSNPMGSDLVRADEFTIHNEDELVRLVRFSDPDAVCLTGGEPTLYMDRAERFARLLREECGPDFHIQFFTANAEMTEEQMARVHKAGVDEIRCHLASYKEAHLVQRARGFDWTVAVEIPSLPIADITDRIVDQSIELGAEFVNLHELLFFEHENFQRVAKRTDLQPGEPLSRKIPYQAPPDKVFGTDIPARFGTTLRPTLGSKEKAERMMRKTLETPGSKTAVHFCSMASKYLTQIPNRLARKARRFRRPYEDVTPDGTLVSALITAPDEPSLVLARQKLADTFRLEDEQVARAGNLLMVPWTVALKRARFGELAQRLEISLYERYPVPEDARMSDDGIYIEFPLDPGVE
jgi:pyruvate formate-lyase activating enzyme-like uncharacterized protein